MKNNVPLGAVTGAQPKLLVVRDGDRYREPGRAPAALVPAVEIPIEQMPPQLIAPTAARGAPGAVKTRVEAALDRLQQRIRKSITPN